MIQMFGFIIGVSLKFQVFHNFFHLLVKSFVIFSDHLNGNCFINLILVILKGIVQIKNVVFSWILSNALILLRCDVSLEIHNQTLFGVQLHCEWVFLELLFELESFLFLIGYFVNIVSDIFNCVQTILLLINVIICQKLNVAYSFNDFWKQVLLQIPFTFPEIVDFLRYKISRKSLKTYHHIGDRMFWLRFLGFYLDQRNTMVIFW